MLKGKRSVTPSRDKDKGKKASETSTSGGSPNKNNSIISNTSNMSNTSASDNVNNNPNGSVGTGNVVSGNVIGINANANGHWNDIVQETILSASNPEQLYFRLIGGADEGQFPHVAQLIANPDELGVEVRGFGLAEGDVLLEIQGQKVSGYTGSDVEGWLKHCLSNGNMIVIRAVPQGKLNILHAYLDIARELLS